MIMVRKSKRRSKHRKNRASKIWISAIVLVLLVVMSVQILRLNEKNKNLIAQEKAKTEQLEEEKERAQDIAEYEQYTKSQQFVEDTAKSKLGLVHDNEIIFKKE